MEDIINKLKFKNQEKVLILDLPDELKEILNFFPKNVDKKLTVHYDFILVFESDYDSADKRAEKIIKALNNDGYLWFCYPKGTSKKIKSNINRNNAWDIFKPYNFRPVSQIAINEDWSALRFRDADLVNK